MKGKYLFSIDLEDIRLLMPNGQQFKERVPALTETLLEFLRLHQAKITFFVVGDMARMYPQLIRKIIDDGHEIACHTDKHVPLDKLGPEGFQKDLIANVQALRDAGAERIIGFRAPIFSLTESTSWAFKILSECGFQYSSSVLPADSPLYGWKAFGTESKVVDSIREFPMTIGRVGPLTVPFAGGIYFRVFPKLLLQWLFSHASKDPILGYLHPYDIDTEQERFMHPGIKESQFYNWLMYYGRAPTLPKLSWFLRHYSTLRYDELFASTDS